MASEELGSRLTGFLSRQLLVILTFEAAATYLVASKIIDGGCWTTVTIALATLAITGNAATKLFGYDAKRNKK